MQNNHIELHLLDFVAALKYGSEPGLTDRHIQSSYFFSMLYRFLLLFYKA